jgi:putative redox protein
MTEITDSSKWVSAIIRNDRYRTEVLTSDRRITADEPIAAGGTDLGPSPGDFLRISLASCTAITLRMYADRKKFDVQQVEVKVSSESVGEKTILHCSIQITGKLTDKERKRMLEIANHCPIHRMLTRPLEIKTSLL